MTMNLDVVVRLIDQTSRPGRDATAALDKFGSTANRLASRLTSTTRAIKGLAGALQAVKAADGAADRATASTGRLRGTMAAIGPAARTASTGLDRFGRAADRVAAASMRATASTRQLHAALGTSLQSGGFAAGAESQLRNIVNLQRTALDQMRRLNAGSGGGGGSGGSRRGYGAGHSGAGGPGVMGHAFFGATSGIVMGGHAIRELYEQGAQRVDEYQKMAAAGISAAQIARNRQAALVTSRLVGGSGINTNLATLRHLRFALGSDVEAERALTPVAKASQTMRWMNPEIDAEGNAFAMAKAAEMKGVSQDPAKFTRYMGVMANTAIATGGKTTGQDFRAFTAMSKGAATFLSEDAYAGLVSSIGGELGASKTGNALAMATRANIGGVMTGKGRGQLEKLGLWDVRAGTIVKADDFQRDPHRWVEDNLIPVLKANGMLQMDKEGNVDPEKSKEVGKLFAKMFSNSNVASLFTLLTTQGSRYEKDQALRNKVALDNFALQQKSPTFAMNAMTEAFKNMLGTMSEADMPQLVSGLNALTGAFNNIAGMNPKSLGLVTELGAGFLALGPAIWAARLAYMTFILPVRQLPMLLRGGATAIGIMRTETFAATVATWGLNTASAALATTLGRVLAGAAALGAGYKGGGFISGALDKLDVAGEDAGKSDRTKQADIMTAQRHIVEQNKVWNDPKAGYWAHFVAGQEADKARRFLDARGAPHEEGDDVKHGPAWGKGVPIAGARALGGPVGNGKSYLVGERGPEIFTPGMSGAISTHAATKLALGGGGAVEGGAAGDDGMAREVRYMSFALVSAVDDIARAVDRLGRGRLVSGLDLNAGGGGGGGDLAPADAGGGGGGRRGFMGRMSGGRYGGRRGLGLGGGGAPLSADKSAFAGGYKDNPAIHDYIVASAKARGIDPAVALKVWGHEGHAGYVGDEHSSFGPFQLHYGGISRSMPHAGMGDDFTKATGLDARDPTTIRQQVDFAMNHVRRHGWGAWMGAKAEGITGFRGVGPMPGGDPGITKDRTPLAGLQGGGGRPGVAGSLVAKATSMLGFNDQQAAHALGKGMHAGAWCADFVNGMLQSKGMRGSGSAMANSFFKWGQRVSPGAAKSGDVLVSGHHVGFAKGPAEMHNGRLAYPMISGNYGHAVKNGWADAREYEARRDGQGEVPDILADRARRQGARDRAADAARTRVHTASAASGMHIGAIHIAVHPHPHQDHKQIAAAVHERFNDSVRSQLNDGAFA